MRTFAYRSWKRLTAFLPLLLAFLVSASAQTNVFVSAAMSNDNGDGTTWATAKKSLASALTLAGSNGTVFVKAGTYTLTEELSIPTGVTVMGGYVTSLMGTDTSQRHLPGVNSHWQDATYCSILKGDNTFRIATVEGTLEGCVLRDGFDASMGGGLLIDGGTARYCVIMGCDAIDDNDASAEGGGAYIRNNGTLINCVVTECRGDNGSAVSGEDGSLINNTITRNWPSQCGTVTDYDGNVYHTVRLGEQCWMRENLRTTHYADGTAIATTSGRSLTVPYYYQNTSLNVVQYGLYYNWAALMNGASATNDNPSGVQGICPDGWHVPSADEWRELVNFMSSIPHYRCGTGSGSIAKALASRTGWYSSSNTCTTGNTQSTNNASGFNAMPAGCYVNGYYNVGSYAHFASSTNENNSASSNYSTIRTIGYSSSNTWVETSYYYKEYAYSVRCILDE